MSNHEFHPDSGDFTTNKIKWDFVIEILVVQLNPLRASLVTQVVKNLPAMQETGVQSLCREDPPGEGNGNSLQYSCPKNSTDRGAWQP